MGKKSTPSPPPAPNPAATASAQGAANVDAAIAQSFLNQTGYRGPEGSISYSPSGQTLDVGSGADKRTLPQYTQNVSLSPDQQRQYDLENQISEASLGLGKQQIGAIERAISPQFDISGNTPLPSDYAQNRADIENKLYSGYTGRLEDRFGRQQSSLENQLSNQGLERGSEAFASALRDFEQGRTDAYQQAATTATREAGAEQSRLFGLDLTGRQQGIQEQVLERSQPINEVAALLGLGGGVALPQFAAPAPQTGVGAADITGPTALAYQGALNNYNTQQQAQNAYYDRLFGLAGKLGSAYVGSDIRIKDKIKRVGTLDNGLPVYIFTYKGGNVMQLGLMAQDVEQLHPEAVLEAGGIKHVDYERAVL